MYVYMSNCLNYICAHSAHFERCYMKFYHMSRDFNSNIEKDTQNTNY